MPRPVTYDHLKANKPRLQAKVPVYLDDDAIEKFENLREELERAVTRHLAIKDQQGLFAEGDLKVRTSPILKEAEEDVARLKLEVAAAETAVRESTVWFQLRSVGRKRYEALVNAYPASDDQIKEAVTDGREKPPYNAETFAPALLSACCSEPNLTVEEAQEIFDDWTISEVTELFTACITVNTGRRTVVLGNG